MSMVYLFLNAPLRDWGQTPPYFAFSMGRSTNQVADFDIGYPCYLQFLATHQREALSGKLAKEIFPTSIRFPAINVANLNQDMSPSFPPTTPFYKRVNILRDYSSYDDNVLRYETLWYALAELLRNCCFADDVKEDSVQVTIPQQRERLWQQINAMMTKEIADTQGGPKFSVDSQFLQEEILAVAKESNLLGKAESTFESDFWRLASSYPARGRTNVMAYIVNTQFDGDKAREHAMAARTQENEGFYSQAGGALALMADGIYGLRSDTRTDTYMLVTPALSRSAIADDPTYGNLTCVSARPDHLGVYSEIDYPPSSAYTTLPLSGGPEYDMPMGGTVTLGSNANYGALVTPRMDISSAERQLSYDRLASPRPNISSAQGGAAAATSLRPSIPQHSSAGNVEDFSSTLLVLAMLCRLIEGQYKFTKGNKNSKQYEIATPIHRGLGATGVAKARVNIVAIDRSRMKQQLQQFLVLCLSNLNCGKTYDSLLSKVYDEDPLPIYSQLPMIMMYAHSFDSMRHSKEFGDDLAYIKQFFELTIARDHSFKLITREPFTFPRETAGSLLTQIRSALKDFGLTQEERATLTQWGIV